MFALGGAGNGFRDAIGASKSDPRVALFEIGTWMPFQGNMLLFPIMALVCLAIMVYFIRDARDAFHWFKTGLAPLIGFCSITFAIYLMLKNRGYLTTGSNTGWTFAVPFYALGIFLGGCAIALIYQRWSKHRYEAIGKFVHEEA